MRGPSGGGLLVTASKEFPSTLPGLALWFDGRQPGFTAGSALATVPYGRVARIAQPAPLTGNWTSSGSSSPWREQIALDFHYANPSGLLQPASPAIPGNNCTVAMAFQTRLGQGLASPFVFAVGAAYFGFYYTSGTWYLSNPTGNTLITELPSPVLIPGDLIAQVTLVVTARSDHYDLLLTVDGTAYAVAIPIVPAPENLQTLTLGTGLPGFNVNAHAAISEFVVYNQAQSPSDCAKLQAWLLLHPTGDPSVQAPLVAFLGDSIGAAWPPNLQPTFDSTTPMRWVNGCVAGAHVVDAIPGFYQTDIKPLYSALRAKNVLVNEGISVNDVALFLSEGKTPAETAALVLTNYYALCDTIKADGWRGIVMDLLPSTTLQPGFDTARALINTDIRANWPAHGAVFYDIGATPGMSTRADAGNTALFYDGTHPTAAGYVVLDTTLQPALAAALA
jgi:lysophospholipase L1-like esterase